MPVNQDEYIQRVEWICQQITEGKSKTQMVGLIKNKYKVKVRQAYLWITEAYEYFRKGNSKWVENLRTMQLERMENLYQRAIGASDFKTANDVLKSITNLYGLEASKTPEMEMRVDDKVVFHFGGAPISNDTPKEENKAPKEEDNDNYDFLPSEELITEIERSNE